MKKRSTQSRKKAAVTPAKKKKSAKKKSAGSPAKKKSAKRSTRKSVKKSVKKSAPSPAGNGSGKKKDDRFFENLDTSLISKPLLDEMRDHPDAAIHVVIDLNFLHHQGLSEAKLRACRLIRDLVDPASTAWQLGEILDELSQKKVTTIDEEGEPELARAMSRFKTGLCPQYVFACLTPGQIRALLENDHSLAEIEARDMAGEEARKETEKVRNSRTRKKDQSVIVESMMKSMNVPRAHDVGQESVGAESEEAVKPEAVLQAYRLRSVYKIWPDFATEPHLTRSLSTVKADAAHAAFSASGEGIVWAVVDSGIQHDHPHFKMHGNLKIEAPLQHVDFTIDVDDDQKHFTTEPVDEFGHGTHVAGIIAGQVVPSADSSRNADAGHTAVKRLRDEKGSTRFDAWKIRRISGISPRCKLVSLRVLNKRGRDPSRRASNIIAALAYVHKLNEYGRNLRIHGVNLSVGYEFEAEWFGCGQSPLCVEVDRLVRSGVIVVAAAGNTGYGRIAPETGGPNMAGIHLTINDPGNAALAITVGSTHRESPHSFGVSYFSSKGPTGDGRLKPDLVAPGENVLSCAVGEMAKDVNKDLARQQEVTADKLNLNDRCVYREESGTSMAAPHVSGAIAAFLSIRKEFIGQSERIREIFLSTATDLHRERYFQGHGLVDLMRAIQSV